MRAEENPDLPQNSTIGEKTSDIVGNAKYIPNKYFNIDYNFSLDSSLDTSNYDSIKANLSLNNFVTTFEFLQEQNIICLLYTSPSPRDKRQSRMPSSA